MEPYRRHRAEELIEIIADGDAPRGLWQPIVGPEAESVIEQVPQSSRATLREESCEVLGQCIPPTEREGSRTGLVVGYIQSGKTLSFTTVSALAHDNGYRMVIVITGISLNLFDQSNRRIRSDLTTEGWNRRWQIYRSDQRQDDDIPRSIRADLERWRDDRVPEADQRTVLITVMKNRAHLDWLHDVLSQLDLSDVLALIIDDEGDQASLNIEVQNGEESSTYRRILRVRSLFSNHTFLQYTATPQAPLLINLIDRLSPDFAVVLTPGEDYTGGHAFFERNLERLITRIPDSDVPSRHNRLTQPPASLLEAMRIFLVGVAAGMIGRSSLSPTNRSMIVHPDRRTDLHATFARWVRHILDHWEEILDLPEDNRDRRQLIRELESAYNDLSRTAENLPPFLEIERRLPQAVRETRVLEVNARGGSTPTVPWDRSYAWILVGGQALDRGFTVEGLTVTYMPRSLGVGNADTVQQRARWFGYKAGYLGYCRVYLPDPVIQAYREYVEHEEDIRRRLREFVETGQPLQEWARVFRMSPSFRPTRHQVLGFDYIRGNFSDRWFAPQSPHDSEQAVEDNRALVEAFFSQLSFRPDEGDPRRLDSHRHEVAVEVPLRDTYEGLLLGFKHTAPTDSLRYTGLLLQIESYLEDHPDATCIIYRMRPGQRPGRGTDPEGERISQLFQGAYPVQGPNKIYPGDRNIKIDEVLTIQLHRLDIYRGREQDQDLLMEDVPVLAVWVPSEMSRPWIAQDQSS